MTTYLQTSGGRFHVLLKPTSQEDVGNRPRVTESASSFIRNWTGDRIIQYYTKDLSTLTQQLPQLREAGGRRTPRRPPSVWSGPVKDQRDWFTYRYSQNSTSWFTRKNWKATGWDTFLKRMSEHDYLPPLGDKDSIDKTAERGKGNNPRKFTSSDTRAITCIEARMCTSQVKVVWVRAES